MMRAARQLGLFAVLLLPAAACARTDAERAARQDAVAADPGLAGFLRLIEKLSEPGGTFPSDNLVSNETSYLHVIPTLRELGVRGGAYVGVGPDQNFSYIAHIKPEIAFIIDIRRDNLLHHLLLKALFQHAHNRVEYLCLMTGKPVPADLERWNEATIDEITLYIDTVNARTGPDLDLFEEFDERLLATVQSYGYPLSEADLGMIRGIHATFFDFGLDIRYSPHRRGGFYRFPTWRQLMLQTDLEGNRLSYLASEENFRIVQDLQRRHLVVPVVGDLAGLHALEAIGREAAARGLPIRAFYVSNVEQYLMQGPEFYRYAGTVTDLPFDDRSVIIRSYFARRWAIPQTMPNHMSAQLLERFEDFVREQQDGGYLSYMDLVTKNVLPLAGTADSLRAAAH
jgi:hypothetical protein